MLREVKETWDMLLLANIDRPSGITDGENILYRNSQLGKILTLPKSVDWRYVQFRYKDASNLSIRERIVGYDFKCILNPDILGYNSSSFVEAFCDCIGHDRKP